MSDELLEQTGLAVLGLPGFEFIAVSSEQLGQVTSIGTVMLGAAGDEGFAILLQGDGIDGKESDPGIGFQEGDEMAGGLFEAQGDGGIGMTLAQIQKPAAKIFGRTGYGAGLGLAGSALDEVEVGFGIGTVQADNEVEGLGMVDHNGLVC